MKMTIDQFENIVLKLANQTPTRYQKHWNYPCESPWLMAVSIPIDDGDSLEFELKKLGMTRITTRDYRHATFTVERDIAAELRGRRTGYPY